MKYLQFDKDGNVFSCCEAYQEIPEHELPNDMVLVDFEVNNVSAFNYAVNPKTKEVVFAGDKPNSFSCYSFANECWELNKDLLKNQIAAICNEKRQTLFSGSVLFKDFVFDADGVTVSNIQSTLTMCSNGFVLPENFSWRSADNSNVPMTLQDLKDLAAVIFKRNAQIYGESWALKDSLDSKTDDELLALYESLTQPVS